MPNSGQSSDDSATPILPTQPTERPAGCSPSAAADSDRIPSYVFATTTTAGPAEWSVASNESLFSIHMGNMSFTRDQLSWMSKSGELNYTCDSTLSGPLPDIPRYNQTPPISIKSPEISKKSGNLNEGRHGSVTEAAAAAETMREVLREKESQRKDKESPHSRSVSQHSDASVKSFAFPILTGDADKSGSSTKNKNQLSQPSTPKTTPQTPKRPQSPPGTPKPETPNSQTPKATRNAGGPKRWLSCFSCCPPRSRDLRDTTTALE